MNTHCFLHYRPALDSLGFGSYKDEARAVLQEAKAVAAKKRRASSKLENLGIPEEELLRQQQELFAKVILLIFFSPLNYRSRPTQIKEKNHRLTAEFCFPTRLQRLGPFATMLCFADSHTLHLCFWKLHC